MSNSAFYDNFDINPMPQKTEETVYSFLQRLGSQVTNSIQKLNDEMQASASIIDKSYDLEEGGELKKAALLITKDQDEFRKLKKELRQRGAITTFGTTAYLEEVVQERMKEINKKKKKAKNMKKSQKWRELTAENEHLLLSSIFGKASSSLSYLQNPVHALSHELCFVSNRSISSRTISAQSA